MVASVDFFEKNAATWEDKCYPPAVRQQLEYLIDEFGVQPGTQVLDAGTGTGILLPYLKQRIGTQGLICAVDLSYNMLREAQKKINRAAVDTELRKASTINSRFDDLICQADVHHLPFSNGCFDQVICFAAFPHFDQPARALEEISRVLRNGGRAIIAHLMSRLELARHHGNHEAVAEDVLPNESDMRCLFDSARLKLTFIEDIPGRYLVQGIKAV